MFQLAIISAIVIHVQSESTTSTPYTTQYEAVVRMYRPNQSLEANVYHVMSVLCPESVYCACAGDGYTSCRENKLNQTTSAYGPSGSELNLGVLDGCCSPCSCTVPDCYEAQDCCREVPRRSLPESGRRQFATECMPAANVAYVKYGDSVRPVPEYYSMVTDCFTSGHPEQIVRLCREPSRENASHVLPVSSWTTGRVYRNKYCAACNNDTDIVHWQLLAKLSRFPERSNINFTFDYETIFAMDRRGTVHFLPPENVPEVDKNRCFPDDLTKAECRKRPIHEENPNYDFLVNACYTNDSEYKHSSIYVQNTRFQNVFCLLCSTSKMTEATQETCRTEQTRTIIGFTMLLRLKDDKPTEYIENVTDEGTCKCREWFDEFQSVCRPVLCPMGEILAGCGCERPVLKVAGLLVDLRFEIAPSITPSMEYGEATALLSSQRFTYKLLNAVTTELQVASGGVSVQHIALYLAERDSNLIFYLISSLTTNFGYDTRDEIKNIYSAFAGQRAVQIQNIEISICLGKYLDIFMDLLTMELSLVSDLYFTSMNRTYASHMIHSSDLITKSLQFQKLVYCDRVILTQNERIQLQDYGNSSDSVARRLQYIYQEESSTMCFEDFVEIFRLPTNHANCKNNYRFSETVCIVLSIIVHCLT